MVILSSWVLRVKHILGILIYCSYGILLKLMPSHGFYNWPRVCPRPWAQLWRKMHWKKQSFFLLAGGPICFIFFRCGLQGTVAKIEEIRKSSKFSLASLFDAIKILRFFDLNRWWIQEETAPRFYTFGHLRQHPALGALYRVFWMKFSTSNENTQVGGWMSRRLDV